MRALVCALAAALASAASLGPVAARAQTAGTASAAAPSAAALPDGGRFGSMFQFTEPDGAAIYRNVCAGCHMVDGRGATGAGAYPALAGDTRLGTAAYVVAVVLHGQKAMPAFARYLSDQQVADVVAYVRGRFGGDQSAGASPDDVKAAR